MNRWPALGCGLIAGAVAALGHAPFPALIGLMPAVLMSMLGFVGLFFLTGLTKRPVLLAWAAGAGYFGVALHWIVEPFLVEPEVHGWMAPFALMLMAAGLALFWALGAWVARWSKLGTVGFALALAVGELARGYLFTGFPWALPAYIWTDTPVMGLAAVVGPFGLTAMTFLVAAVVADLQHAEKSAGPKIGAISLVVVASLILLRVVPLVSPPDVGRPLGTVLLAQPDARQDEKWDPEKGPAFVRNLIDMSAAARDGGADFVVWPETAVPFPLDVAGPVLAAAVAATGGVPVLTGLNRRDGDDWHNSLAIAGAGGQVVETYDKVHLVPFGEYIPFRIELLRAMAAMSTFGFTPGAEARLINTPLGQALPLICYEAIFPGHGRGAGRPDYLLQITNDAWFGTFAGPQQHLQQARFRAVEQGLPMVRVANRGISAVIGPAGDIIDARLPGTPSAFAADVPVPLPATLYSRTGDLPVALILGLALVGLAVRKKIASDASAS